VWLKGEKKKKTNRGSYIGDFSLTSIDLENCPRCNKANWNKKILIKQWEKARALFEDDEVKYSHTHTHTHIYIYIYIYIISFDLILDFFTNPNSIPKGNLTKPNKGPTKKRRRKER
jgi:hypothetical protein